MEYDVGKMSEKQVFVNGMRWQLNNERKDYNWKYSDDVLPGYLRFLTIYKNRIHAQRGSLDKMSDEERREAIGEASTVLLDSLRAMNFPIEDPSVLEQLIKNNPQNIQYMDLLGAGIDKREFLTKIINENPESLSFLSEEQFNDISGSNIEYITQLVKGNMELASRSPISEIIAKNPELTKEVTIMKKEAEVARLQSELAKEERELDELKGQEVPMEVVQE